MEIKTKISKWDLVKLKSLCTAKETICKMKRQSSEWQKLLMKQLTKNYLQNIQVAHAAQYQNNSSIKKQAESLKELAPKKTYRWPTNI